MHVTFHSCHTAPALPPLVGVGVQGGPEEASRARRLRPPGCVGSEVPAGSVLTLGVWQKGPSGSAGRHLAQREGETGRR